MKEKAYIVHFPQGLPAETYMRLKAWGDDNCWRSKLTEGRGGVSWIAVRERSRSKEQSISHVERVLREIGVHSTNWTLQILNVNEAQASIERRGATGRAPPRDTSRDDVKIVEIAGSTRQRKRAGGGRAALQISKERGE